MLVFFVYEIDVFFSNSFYSLLHVFIFAVCIDTTENYVYIHSTRYHQSFCTFLLCTNCYHQEKKDKDIYTHGSSVWGGWGGACWFHRTSNFWGIKKKSFIILLWRLFFFFRQSLLYSWLSGANQLPRIGSTVGNSIMNLGIWMDMIFFMEKFALCFQSWVMMRATVHNPIPPPNI